jgi:RNA polymerase sigma-70 factor (ECF subfamily)
VQAATDPRAPTAREKQVALLFERHRELVFRAAYRVTGAAADAEDVLQNVFLRILRGRETVVVDETAGSYLHRAAVNAALDVLRRRHAARTDPLDERQERIPDPGPGPAAAAAVAALRDRLRAALAGLSPRSAEIFVLSCFEGYGNREIARMLGTSWSTVSVSLHRTRARLRKSALGGLR